MDSKDVDRKLALSGVLILIAVLIVVFNYMSSCSTEKKSVAPQSTEIPQTRPTEAPPPIKDPSTEILSNDEIEQAVLSDISLPSFNDTDRLNIRYLDLSDVYNENSDVDTAGLGIQKSLNQLSSERFLKSASPIPGTQNSVYRIDLRDYFGSSRARLIWKLVEEKAVVKIVSQTIRGKTLQFLTQTLTPVMKGKVFTLTALTGATYYDIVGIPTTLASFYKNFVGVVPQNEFDQRDSGIVLSGNQKSQIGQNNRLYWRLDGGRNGAVYQSFDVRDGFVGPEQTLSISPFPPEVNPAGSVVPPRLASDEDFQGWCWPYHCKPKPKPPVPVPPPYPTEAPNPQPTIAPQEPKPIPGAVALTNRIYKHAASEVIAYLPNGMFAFGLFDAAGNRQNAAPQDVVTNTRAVALGLSSVIGNALDCTGCHQSGFISMRDDIAKQIKSSTFNAEEKKLGELFRPQSVADAFMAQDNSVYTGSLEKLGIKGGPDPINVGMLDSIRTGVSLAEGAAFFGLSPEEMKAGVQASEKASADFQAWLDGKDVTFQAFTNGAAQLIIDLNLFQDAE